MKSTNSKRRAQRIAESNAIDDARNVRDDALRTIARDALASDAFTAARALDFVESLATYRTIERAVTIRELRERVDTSRSLDAYAPLGATKDGECATFYARALDAFATFDASVRTIVGESESERDA